MQFAAMWNSLPEAVALQNFYAGSERIRENSRGKIILSNVSKYAKTTSVPELKTVEPRRVSHNLVLFSLSSAGSCF